jgi:hypothetical protein
LLQIMVGKGARCVVIGVNRLAHFSSLSHKVAYSREQPRIQVRDSQLLLIPVFTLPLGCRRAGKGDKAGLLA